MIRINYTLHQFLRKNTRAGISNMEDSHEMMLWSWTCVFRDPMTIVLMHIISLLKGAKTLKVDAFLQKSTDNFMKTYPWFRWDYSESTTELGFWNRNQNLADRTIYRPKWKHFEKSISKYKHLIKLRNSRKTCILIISFNFLKLKD